MLTFGGAFTSLCFIATNTTTRAILAVICAVITTLTVWCVVYNWEEGRVHNKQDTAKPRRNWLPTFRWRRLARKRDQAGVRPGWWPVLGTKGAQTTDFELPVTQPTAATLPHAGEPL